MSTISSQKILSPNNVLEEVAALSVSDVTEAFTISEVTVSGGEYTLSFWAKSESDGGMVIGDFSASTNTKWSKHVYTYTATGPDLIIGFSAAGTYYIYHLQLEVGTMATDWEVAPEDIQDSIAQLVIDADAIRMNVTAIEDNVATVASSLELTADSFALDIKSVNESIGAVSSSLKQTADSFTVQISNAKTEFDGEVQSVRDELSAFKQESDNITAEIRSIAESDPDKVVTTTGRFDEAGLTIDKSDSATKTQVTPDGMTVYAKDNNNAVMLEATSAGVEAKDLHATTFLKVGGRSRFENYGNDRTGCFWIGGD